MSTWTLQPELTVQTVTLSGSPRVAKAVQHVLEQHRETGTVQPIAMKPSVGSDDGIGVVVHLSKIRRNGSTFHPSDKGNHQFNITPTRKVNSNCTADRFCFRPTTISIIPIYGN
jgi:hypothetical protein